jgi:hypothetical protein
VACARLKFGQRHLQRPPPHLQRRRSRAPDLRCRVPGSDAQPRHGRSGSRGEMLRDGQLAAAAADNLTTAPEIASARRSILLLPGRCRTRWRPSQRASGRVVGPRSAPRCGARGLGAWPVLHFAAAAHLTLVAAAAHRRPTCSVSTVTARRTHTAPLVRASASESLAAARPWLALLSPPAGSPRLRLHRCAPSSAPHIRVPICGALFRAGTAS